MEILPQLTATGVVNGLIYALIAFGFIAIYRVTNVVNFAQGEFVMVGGFLAMTLSSLGIPWPVSLVGAVAVAAILGVVLHRSALQPAGRNASVESLVIVTIGAAFLLRGVAQLIWGSDPLAVPPFTDGEPIRLLRFSVAPQALWIVLFAIVTAVLLWLFFTRTTAGLSLRACAQNRSGADLVGIDSWRMSRVAFALGCGIAGLAGVLLTPLSFVSVEVGVLLGFKGFTVAILGGLRSFTAAAYGGVLLGLIESYTAGYWSSSYRDAVTFVVLLIVLVLRPQGFVRGGLDATQVTSGQATEETITAGTGGLRKHWQGILGVAVIVVVLPYLLENSTLSGFVFAGLFAVVAVGLVLLLGYAGQISLGHASLMGIGGYSSAVLTLRAGFPPLVALAVGVLLSCSVAWIIAKIIFRFEGFYLAMATLGLTIIATVVATQWTGITGGSNGIPGIASFSLLGFNFVDTQSSLYLAWGVALLSVVLALLLIDSRFGRSMRAIKGSEPAAVVVGVDPSRVKRQVFVISAGLAAIAGSLFVHYSSLANPGSFDLFQAIQILVMVVVGGMHSVWGALLGSVFITLVPETIQQLIPSAQAGQIEQVVFGIVLIVVMVVRPDGLAGVIKSIWRVLVYVVPGRLTPSSPSPVPLDDLGVSPTPTEVASTLAAQRSDEIDVPVLDLRGISKAFGGLQALQPLEISIRRGSITALIGPNGAGKTTAFDCIAGSLRPDQGSVLLDGERIDQLRPHHVASRGLIRTFQNVRLFKNMSVLENVMVGCHSWTAAGPYEAALRIGRHRREEREIAEIANHWLDYVGLMPFARRPAATLPFGHQRMLELARAMAAKPRMLLLDEPAAGLNRVEKDDLVELLDRIRGQGVTLLLVEHDMTLVMELAEWIVVLDHGAVIARGRPEEIRNDGAVVEAYLGVDE